MTNAIGIVYLLLSTNFNHAEFIAKPCNICLKAHHYRVNEFFTIKGTNWVNVIQSGKLTALELDDDVPVRTNSIARLIDDPAKYSHPK